MIPLFNSGAEETRTLYLIAASDALSQVSYDPVPNKDSTVFEKRH